MNDHLTMSWFSVSPVEIQPGEILFTIVARAKTRGNLQQSFQLNSDITNAELYSSNDEIFIPKIVMKSNNEDQLTLLAPEPNPWSTTCTIPFHVQKGGNLIFTIYNVNGIKVFFEEKYYSSGYYEIKMNVGDITSDGLLFYTFQKEGEIRSGKLIKFN